MRRPLATKDGGGSAPLGADLFLAELFGGVVNKPREGTVVSVHQNAVARLSGLREARIHDLVAFAQADGSTRQGLVVDLEQNMVAVAPLDKDGLPEVGTDAALTGQSPSIPVGAELLGRVVDPLGRPLPHLEPAKKDTAATAADPKEPSSMSLPLLSSQHRAPGIMARKPLCHRLRTGVKAVDVFHPLGHGQCVGVLGKPGSGKTSLALQILANQKEDEGKSSVRCIYVAIGQEERTVKRSVAELDKLGCLPYVTVVAATQDMLPGLRYLAPFAACALGEHWRDHGGRALVIFDDLSRHAEAYSELAKFMAKPEVEKGLALHGPLLERFAQLSDTKGGGAMTALALVEGEATSEEDGGSGGGPQGAHGLAHRINSIVDHAINLNLDLARKKIFPAVDVTHQMNLQSPGAALLPEPAKACVQQLRVVLAEALDDEAGAKLAEELGIRVADEAEERKLERLEYLRKVRVLFQQDRHGNVDDGGVLLLLLCCLQHDLLMDLDVEMVRQLDLVLSTELPQAKGWQKLRGQVDALAQQADARTVAEAFWEAHTAHAAGRKGRRSSSSRGHHAGETTLPYVGTASLSDATRALTKEAGQLYRSAYDIVTQAINYSRKKQQIAKLSGGGGGGGGGSGGGGRAQASMTNTRRRQTK